MTTARQAAPSTAPMRRRQDRALPENTDQTHHERLRWAVVKFGHGWLHAYADGAATWAGLMDAVLFSDERAADAVARQLGGRTSLVFLKSDAEVMA